MFPRRKRQETEELEDTLASITWDAETQIAVERAEVISRGESLGNLDPLSSFALSLLRDTGALPIAIAEVMLQEALTCHENVPQALWRELENIGLVRVVLAGASPDHWIVPTRRAYLLFAGCENDAPLL
jgi:hypothetical protein